MTVMKSGLKSNRRDLFLLKATKIIVLS
jgi:hypothetical protein